MEKLIIHNESELDMDDALALATTVIKAGRISSSLYGPQYCFVTTFADDYVVYATKRAKTTDTLLIATKTKSPSKESETV